MDVRADPTRQLVRLRGRSYVAFVFSPVVPIVEWLAEIDATLARSPGYFVGKPIVLDLAPSTSPAPPSPISSAASTSATSASSASRAWRKSALAASMPPLLTGGRACVITRNEPAQKPEPEAKPKPTSLLLDSPVRSGQSIVFMEGDVTVLGSVGSGAEIVAGGSIHIYGTLRGRAMAGVNGNSNARIYCQRIEAELLAIDGYYQTAEEIDVSLRNRPAQAWLEGDTMKITPLN